MTVQELIDILNTVEDKTKDVNIETEHYGSWNCEDALIVYECKDIDIGIIISSDKWNEQNEDRIVYA
jgi:hypothetical protein